jgi:uncharacterized membrane protein
MIKARLKKYFITGFIVLIPIGAVYQIIKWILSIGDDIFMVSDGKFLFFIPEKFAPAFLKDFPIPGIGFLFLIIVVLIIGAVGTNIFGKKVVTYIENLFLKIPFVKKIYLTVKQVTIKILQKESIESKKVVIVSYPRDGMYTLGFLTGESPNEFKKKSGKNLVNVFIATVPNPTTGFFYTIPREDLINTKISPETAMKMILSAGMAKID